MFIVGDIIVNYDCMYCMLREITTGTVCGCCVLQAPGGLALRPHSARPLHPGVYHGRGTHLLLQGAQKVQRRAQEEVG